MIQKNDVFSYSLYSLLDQEETREQFGPETDQRFVDIAEREDKCDLPMPIWEILWEKTFLQTWNGVFHDRGMFELSSFPILIKELKPKTIIELGALSGGGAMWLADLLNAFHIEGTVYSVDIDLSLLVDKAKDDSRIHFIEGDCNNMETVFSTDFLSTLPHPWLVLEDCHVDTLGILDYLHHNGLESGDYLIIEDTNKHIPEYWKSRWHNPDELTLIENKLDNLRSWLKQHPNEYLVDTHYLDMYGYNVSKNWNSVLKKV
jgi:cephalosporin hydroxylase